MVQASQKEVLLRALSNTVQVLHLQFVELLEVINVTEALLAAATDHELDKRSLG